jgi:hypothetical protein
MDVQTNIVIKNHEKSSFDVFKQGRLACYVSLNPLNFA